MDVNKRLDSALKKLNILYDERIEYERLLKFYTDSAAKLHEEWLLLDKQSKFIFNHKMNTEILAGKQIEKGIQLFSAAKDAHDRYERCKKQAELWTELANMSLAEYTKLTARSNEMWVMRDEDKLLYEKLVMQSDFSPAVANGVYEQYDWYNKQAKAWKRHLGKLNKRITTLELKKKSLIEDSNTRESNLGDSDTGKAS